MCRAMSFSARALKENIFFDVDIVVKKHKNVKIETSNSSPGTGLELEVMQHA